MNFLELPPRKTPRAILPHAMILSTFALSLLGFVMARDEFSGRGQLADVLPYTTIFLALGYFLGWLPEIWGRTRGMAAASCVLPAFFGLIVAYLFCVFRVYFVQPTAVAATVVLQRLVMIGVSRRNLG